MHVITTLGLGGAEAMLFKLLSSGNHSFTSTVVCLDKNERAYEAPIRELGVPVVCLGLRRSLPNPMAAIAIRRVVKRFSPQIIQGWMPHGNLLAMLAASWSVPRVPLLWNIRMSLAEVGGEPRLTRAVIRLGALLSWYPRAVVYNSIAGAEQHEAIGYRAEKRVFIPNGFDCEVFRPDENARHSVRCELGIGEDTLLVGLVARYHPMKDHAGFLRAAATVVRNCPKVRFVLAGKNVDERQQPLVQTIREQELQNHVFLLGERSDVPQLTAALDIACLASFWGEGFSNAVGEAMACGVPCVVTDIGDSGRIVGDAGLVVPARSPEALAAAILQLIAAGPERRRELGVVARRRMKAEFALPLIVSQYEELYRQFIASGRPGRRELAPSAIDRHANN